MTKLTIDIKEYYDNLDNYCKIEFLDSHGEGPRYDKNILEIWNHLLLTEFGFENK